MTLETGFLLNNRYRIRAVLGQGGMGAVYHATDENLGVKVAVKENFFQNESFARQFQTEAKILANLRHPNLPRVFDYFIIPHQGQYLVMDYIEGEDLRQWIQRRGMISEAEVIQIGIAVCDALAYLHSRKPPIIHRDIKPGNVKITPEGEVVLVDFGLAKIMHSGEDTAAAARAMTPGYSPPEQYGTAPTEPRSDIYSLGATLYAALTGMIPEDSLTQATGKAKLTPIRTHNDKVSPRLAKVIEKSLQIRVNDRYHSAHALKEALLKVQAGYAPEKQTPVNLKAALQGNGNGNAINKPAANAADDDVAAPPAEKAGLPKFMRVLRLIDGAWVVLLITLIFFLISLIASVMLDARKTSQAQGAALVDEPTLSATDVEIAITEATTETVLPVVESPTATLQPTHTTTQQPTLTATPQPTATQTPQPSATHTPTLALSPSATATGGGMGLLAYVSEQTNLPQIWLLDVNSGSTWQLTEEAEGACQPDWAPDGARLVFTSPCLKRSERYPGSLLYIIDINTRLVTALPPMIYGGYDADWSPDGNRMVFTVMENETEQIYLLFLDDNRLIRLSDGQFNDRQPAWSPDGSKIAFIRTRYYDQIWLMSAEGSEAEQFSMSGTTNNWQPAWSADGSIIYFNQGIKPNSPFPVLMAMRLTDKGTYAEYRIKQQGMTDYEYLISAVDASPDGYWLAFELYRVSGNHDVYIMPPAGAIPTRLTTDMAEDYNPVWQPIP